MSKGFKVRRTKSKIYRRNRSRTRSPLGVAAVVVAVAGLFVLGWFVYPPIYNLITGHIDKEPAQSSQPAPAPESSSVPEPELVPEQKPEPTALKMLYAPNNIMKNQQALEALAEKAKNAGCNSLLFEVKDSVGAVLYNTANKTAIDNEAVVQDPLDFAAVTATLARYDLKPAVILHTFKEHIVSRKNIPMAVNYMGTDGLWLDNYVNQGGRSWLNPYDTAAQDYNIALAQECVDGGAVMVMANSVQFPNAVGMNLASYGETGGKTWDAALSGFVTRMSDAVTQKGAEFSVAAVGASMTEGYKGLEYLGKPAEYTVPIAINCMPSYWAWQTPTPNLTPALLAGDTLKTTLGAIQTKKPELIPYVQCYTDSKLPANKNKQYTKAEVDEQLGALKELNLESYILYSPDGVYPF